MVSDDANDTSRPGRPDDSTGPGNSAPEAAASGNGAAPATGDSGATAASTDTDTTDTTGTTGTNSDSTAPRKRRWLHWVWYTLLVVLGGVAIGLFIRHYGADQIGAALWLSLPWLPILLVLEASWIGADTLVWRAFLGGQRAGLIPLRTWVRCSATAYFVMIILPAGRAGGEVARAMGFSRFIGRAAATAGCVHTLGCGLVGNAIISVPCAVTSALVVGWGHSLTWLIASNGIATLLLGLATLSAPRRFGVGRLVGQRDGRWMEGGAAFDEMWRRPLRLTVLACMWSGVGRAIQTVMLATILFALGELSAPWQAFLSEGIYLVSAALGDFSPNQIGVTEGVFVVFGHLSELQRASSALAIALIIRTIQFSCAALCVIGTMVFAPHPANAPANARADGPADEA